MEWAENPRPAPVSDSNALQFVADTGAGQKKHPEKPTKLPRKNPPQKPTTKKILPNYKNAQNPHTT